MHEIFKFGSYEWDVTAIMELVKKKSLVCESIMLGKLKQYPIGFIVIDKAYAEKAESNEPLLAVGFNEDNNILFIDGNHRLHKQLRLAEANNKLYNESIDFYFISFDEASPFRKHVTVNKFPYELDRDGGK